MIEIYLEYLFWRIVNAAHGGHLRFRLLWNKYTNPLRYATLLYAILRLLGENPHNDHRFIIASLQLSPKAILHIHMACMKALIPQASEEIYRGLYEHFRLDLPG